MTVPLEIIRIRARELLEKATALANWFANDSNQPHFIAGPPEEIKVSERAYELDDLVKEAAKRILGVENIPEKLWRPFWLKHYTTTPVRDREWFRRYWEEAANAQRETVNFLDELAQLEKQLLKYDKLEPQNPLGRRQTSMRPIPLLDHESLVAEPDVQETDWKSLLDDVRALPAGIENADNYERAIEVLVTALFYPSLSEPKRQSKIHNGRKRIDITYTNNADSGFFSWLSKHFIAPFVFVECKNYASDPANPELDQLSSRFSQNRGKFGLLICRKIEKKELFASRCRDTAQDDRGFIVHIDDDDLNVLVAERLGSTAKPSFRLLESRFNALIM